MKTWKSTPNGNGGYHISNDKGYTNDRRDIIVRSEVNAMRLVQLLNAAEQLAELNMPAQVTRGSLKEEQAHDDSLNTMRESLSKM